MRAFGFGTQQVANRLVGTAATALFGSVALAGCGGGDDDTPAPTTPDAGAL